MTCRFESSVAAYALGTLDVVERAELAAHLEACPDCRHTLELVAGLPGLLSQLRSEEVTSGLTRPGEALFGRVLEGALAERRRRRRRWLAVAATTAVVFGGVVAVAARDGSDRAVVTAAAGVVHARMTYGPAEDGTELRLELSGVASGQRCRLVAIAAGGRREIAATWGASYSGTATIRSTTTIPPSSLARLIVEDLDGRVLVELPVAN